MLETEVLIIGSGIAGATAALQLASNPKRSIVLITREMDPLESNTRYAQGGIVSRNSGDDEEALVRDMITAGAGATDPKMARLLAKEGPPLVDSILVEKAGVKFDRGEEGEFDWGKEAAHSRRRILHVGDGTGKAIARGLIEALNKCPNVKIIPNTTAVDLITVPHHSRDPLATYREMACFGAYAFDQQEKTIHRFVSKATVLATGGLGRIYRNTTNPPGSRGDGIAMANRARVRIVNTEYVQFHPTALAVPGEERFLVSEAVRGEGGILLTPDGSPFMEKYSPEWKDLAPRHIVARAIHHEMEANGFSYVLLDIATHMPAEDIRARFPNIYEACIKAGIDITSDPIPVVPAAHYACGGVLADEWGRTSIKGLYAVGEVSCTGLHGANRLASTSLLEGLLWGNRTAEHIDKNLDSGNRPDTPAADSFPRWDESGLEEDVDPTLIHGDMQTIQNIMWHYVGLVRSADRLSRAIRELRHLWNEIETFYRSTKLSDGLIGLRNAVEVALIVARAASHNRHSRGCHYRQDSVELEGDRLI
ncbi:MAG TPA: L-aspartate oxidase [Anaerolineae bacterium]|nr:L-aspartate oxidase [Anaerolineae bacterium]